MKKLLLFSAILFFCSFLKAQSNFINQDSAFAQSADCAGGVSINIDSIDFDNIGNYQFFLDGLPYTGSLNPSKIDTFHTYSYSQLFDNGETGPFTLNSWTINGTTYSIPVFSNLNQLLDSMRKWDPISNWQLSSPLIFGYPKNGQAYSCQSLRGLSVGAQNNYCFNEAFLPKGLKISVPAGFHQFVVQDTVTKLRDTIQLRAACIQKDTIRQTLFVGVNRASCINTSQLLGTPQLATFTNFCAKVTTNVTFDSLYNFCISYTGRAVGSDTACVRVCDQYGICDTTYLYITAQANPSRQHFITDTISAGLSRQKCNLAIPSGTIVSYRDMGCRPAGVNITFAIDSVARCVTYTGKAVGSDTACIEVCNTLGVCDTSFLYIQGLKMVPRGQSYVFNDTILIDSIKTKCDFAKPSGTISIFQNLTAASSNVQFSLEPGLKCVSYRGLTVGPDTATIRVCNTEGTCDTTIFYVSAKANVVQPPTGGRFVFNDTISLNAVRQKCDISIPTGTINVFQNICASSSNIHVTFNLDTVSKCVIYSGKSFGIDTACIRVCNTNNRCDTTNFIIETKLAPVSTSRIYNFSDTITVGQSRTKNNFTAPLGAVLIEKIGTSTTNANVQFDINSALFSVTYRGLKVGSDTTTIRICNASNICDTTILRIRALAPVVLVVPKPSVDTIKLKIFERKTFCPDSSELSGSPINLIKFCTPAIFDNSTISLDTPTKCAVITGKKVGVDTFCISICNVAGFCDTTTLYVQVSADSIKPRASVDSITIAIGQLKSYCPDSLELLSGRITSISSCSTTSADNSTITLNAVTKCADLRGVSEGRDTTCMILCNSAGLCDTTTLYIKVVKELPPSPSIEVVNVKIGETLNFSKIDTSQIRGAVDTIYDACPGKNGSHALMVLNRATRRVSITGVNVGSDTMCIVVYNRISMLYDTTTIVANVRDTAGAFTIKAKNDTDTMRQGRTITLKVYANDSLNGKIPTSLTIIRPPLKGKADTISFRQGLISYTADRSPNACGLDSFKYRVCVDTICSEALVVVEVICADSLKAYNAISPNGDGRNDAFRIEGLQKYPNNTLLIFNRWGNEVLNVKKYQNDWQGTWNNKDLPDGTYFYMLRDEDTNEVILTGYLQVLR
jgi:gliding motility-associated-like protein